jgi:hypothetical protein
MTIAAAFVILIGILMGDVCAQGIRVPVKALYGFSRKDIAFHGKVPEQIAQTLEQWGITAVFGGYGDSSMVSALHSRGIRVFAEVALFVGKKHWTRYPRSRPILSTGKPMAPDGWYYGVNPVIPEIRQHGLEIIQRLVERYPLDGIWLDFIRWPCRWDKPNPQLPQTSFDSFTLGAFQMDTGIRIPRALITIPDQAGWILQHHREDWADWKCKQINEFVRQAREMMKRARRRALLGLFGVPWRPADFDGAIRHVIGQDYRALSPHVDVFSPMAYHKLCGRDIPWIAQVTEWVGQETGKAVWPIVQAMDEPEPLSPREFRRVLKTALAASGSEGVIIFNLRALSQEKIEVITEVFGTGGRR